jgi:NitT/TauT family transport system substrate-binding protein
MTRLLAALAAAALALPAAAADKMTLQLNWFHLADHSPIYMALKKGYYQEEGIELTVLRGSGSADSAKKIDLGQGHVGISDAPTVLTAISKGANLRMVAVVYDRPATTPSSRRAPTSARPRTWSAARSRRRPRIRTACCGRRSRRSTTWIPAA